jgi:long-chain acyl-CoA synthetase
MAQDVADTVCSKFNAQVDRLGDRVAMRFRGEDGAWQDVTWAGYGRAVRETAMGLAAVGVRPGDSVSILSRNRPEWHVADLGGICAGAKTVPIYMSNSPSQVAYVAGHSEARVIFVENHEQLLKVEKERHELPGLLHAVIFDGEASADGFVLTLDELRERGRAREAEHPGEYERRWREVGSHDVVTVVYTSGTTGPPKGAILSHHNIVWTANSLLQVATDDEDGRRLSYLPLAHIAERISSEMAQVVLGNQVWFAQSLDTVLQDLQDCKPTIFFAVPRVWEKFHAGILAKLAERPEEQRQMALGLLEIAKSVVELRQAGEDIAPEMNQPLEMAEQMMFRPLREALGLDQVRVAVSGAAPINPEILKFFHAVNLPICEVYGQTEGTGPTSLNPPGHVKIGTVGPPIPGVEVRIAGDGEVLVRGGNVFQGYFKDPEATEAMLEGGWMHSGDVGQLDEEGYLVITDRKKDLIITAQGKNVAPQELENRLKYHPLISQAVVVGDGRKYLAALITLDFEALPRFAGERGIPFSDPAELISHPEVEGAVASAVEAVNAEFSHAEQIKRWKVLPRDFSLEQEEITPTMKVRRRAITAKFSDQIEALYA